jgi:hypothetical protein
MSAEANYDLCEYMLSQMSAEYENPMLAITRWYTGSYALDYAAFLSVASEYFARDPAARRSLSGRLGPTEGMRRKSQ